VQALLLSAGSVHVETIVVNGLLLLPFWAYPPQLSSRRSGPRDPQRERRERYEVDVAQRAIQLP